MRALIFLALFLASCSPMINGHAPIKDKPMVFVIHNSDIGYPMSCTVTWWLESTIVGSTTLIIPGGESKGLTFAALPDGIQVEAAAWRPAVWQTPDYRGTDIFAVDYPSASSTRFP